MWSSPKTALPRFHRVIRVVILCSNAEMGTEILSLQDFFVQYYTWHLALAQGITNTRCFRPTAVMLISPDSSLIHTRFQPTSIQGGLLLPYCLLLYVVPELLRAPVDPDSHAGRDLLLQYCAPRVLHTRSVIFPSYNAGNLSTAVHGIDHLHAVAQLKPAFYRYFPFSLHEPWQDLMVCKSKPGRCEATV